MIVASILSLASAAYTYENRYYLRMVPVPLGLAELVNRGNWLLPASQSAEPRGKLDFGDHNLTTETGLRAVLNVIQTMSPMNSVNGRPDYGDITFQSWVEQIRSKPFFCTDATQLFILAA